jgi:exopolysaccharide biosynthesis WecB/TagA/CpsF family protein
MAFCIGAALEFITGQTKRAPVLARRLGLEWAHRLLTDPRRLWRRYLVEGPAIFLLALRWRKSTA